MSSRVTFQLSRIVVRIQPCQEAAQAGITDPGTLEQDKSSTHSVKSE